MSSWNRLSLQAIPLVVIVSAVSCGAPNSTILYEAAAYTHVTAGLWVEHARLPKAPSSSERERLEAAVASLSGLNADQLRNSLRGRAAVAESHFAISY